MLESIMSGLLSVCTIETVMAISFGVFCGLLFGAIPGISGVMAIALLMPMTFYVSPLVGIPMLIGIYKSGVFAGSISAILLNTPGAPPAVCTTFDGYPLTKKGKAGKALNMALTASVLGCTTSDLLLIACAAPLSVLTLKAGPVERFSLIIFALTIVGSVSGKSILKGIMSCALGCLVASIGISESTGATRFTFGLTELMGGISFVPMLVGLLALPEVITQVGTKLKKSHQTIIRSEKPEDNRVSFKEVKKCGRTIFKSSLIGSFLGAMPGLGATPAAFLAYGEAKRTSKKPEEFGKGSLEGIAAPEAANNATCGAAMIPMLTLSIPGDDVTAILMGAFMIQGITPGPTIFYEHPVVVYGIFGSLIMCNILLFTIAKAGFPVWMKLASLPKYHIFSFVTVFCFIGAYTVNQSLFDIFILILFGVIGYLMKMANFTPVAFIIGFILAPFAERTFDQALTLSDGSFMIFISHPFSVIFFILSIISVIGTGMRKYKISMAERGSVLD